MLLMFIIITLPLLICIFTELQSAAAAVKLLNCFSTSLMSVHQLGCRWWHRTATQCWSLLGLSPAATRIKLCCLPTSGCSGVALTNNSCSLAGPPDHGRRPRHRPERQDLRLLAWSDLLRWARLLSLCLTAHAPPLPFARLLHVLKEHSQ